MSSFITIAFQLTLLTSYLHNLLGLTVSTALHCAVRREISPCTCQKGMFIRQGTKITCERMANFSQVLTALQNRFEPEDEVSLKISYSKLEDLPELSFKQLGLSVKTLHLNHDNLSVLPETVFTGLGGVEYLSLSENSLSAVPHHVLKQMPLVRTLDLGFGNIENVTDKDFQGLTRIKSLVLAGNKIARLDSMSMPRTLHHLHLGHNKLTDLNGTLRLLTGLEWLFLNNNIIKVLDNQLPNVSINTNLTSLFLSNNKLQWLPQEIRNLQVLDVFVGDNNEIRSLDGALAKSRKLKIIDLTHNKLEMLKEDDFLETEELEMLFIGFNLIPSLNSSLLPLRSLKELNLTHNELREFSLQDIRGLRQLRIVDLSHNKISKLGGRMENLVESEARVFELRLEHNELESLSGSLMGLTGLHRLNLSHNRIETISPDDLIGLDDLHILDLSHNRLTTLEETSKTFLPSLEELIASHNALTVLEKDFHGLPVLCWADLSHNKITSMSKELAEKTQCRLHGVNSTLRIYLQGNPVLCDEKIADTITAMESKNNTKIHGAAECPPEPQTTVMPEQTTVTAEHNKVEYNATAAILEPQVIAAQPQPLISSQPQTT